MPIDRPGAVGHTRRMVDSKTRDPGRRKPRRQGSSRDPRLLGWREWVSLPELGVPWIHAKLDTGARTSALHAEQVEHLAATDDRPARVRFQVRPDGAADSQPATVVGELIEERWIRSSNGHRERRPVVRTGLRVGDETWAIELTLTGRGEMGFQMLLGRQALRRRFAVDPARSWVLGIPEDPSQADSPLLRRWKKHKAHPPKGEAS